MSLSDTLVGDLVRSQLSMLDAVELREGWARLAESSGDRAPKPDGVDEDVWKAAVRSWGPRQVRRLVSSMIQEMLPYRERGEVDG